MFCVIIKANTLLRNIISVNFYSINVFSYHVMVCDVMEGNASKYNIFQWIVKHCIPIRRD